MEKKEKDTRGRKPLTPEKRKNRVVLYLTPAEEKKVRAFVAKIQKS